MSDTPTVGLDPSQVIQEVPDHIKKIVAEGEPPEVAPRPATFEHPAAHLPKYRGEMRGALPRSHPEYKRRVRAIRDQRARERERDRKVLEIEARAPSRFRQDDIVHIVGDAKVDAVDEQRGRIRTDHRGALARIETDDGGYVDREGVRRQVVRTEDGHVRGVRQHDLSPQGARRTFAAPKTHEQRVEDRAELARLQRENPKALAAAAFGGWTPERLAAAMSRK